MADGEYLSDYIGLLLYKGSDFSGRVCYSYFTELKRQATKRPKQGDRTKEANEFMAMTTALPPHLRLCILMAPQSPIQAIIIHDKHMFRDLHEDIYYSANLGYGTNNTAELHAVYDMRYMTCDTRRDMRHGVENMRHGIADEWKKLDGTAAIPVATTATVYTPSRNVKASEKFGLYLKAASSGTIDVAVRLEVGMVPPTTEEAADTTNFSVPNGFSDIVNLVDSNAWQKELDLPPFAYIRLKLVGQGSNDATTTVTAKLFKRS